MPISGDFAALDAMANQIKAIAGEGPKAEEFRVGLLTVCAAGARDALDDSFIKSTDPYGKKWKPLQHPSKRRGAASSKPLLDTGRLSSGYTYHITQDGFSVETNIDYAAPHQYGAKIQPHSRVNAALAFDKNGRFVSVRTKAGRKKADKYWLGHVTYAKGITIPRRQMVPMEDTGGIGDKWAKAINAEALAFFTKWLKVE